jgi:hypothetical protein
MKNKHAWIVLMILFAASCAPALRVNYFPGHHRYPPVPPRTVDLLRAEPRRPHDAFAEIRYDPPRELGRREVEWKLREKGGAIGADALVIEVDTVYRERVWVGPSGPYRGRHVHRAVERDHVLVTIAIRYR